MRLKIIEGEFAVAKLADGVLPDLTKEFMFFAKTDEENSLVCRVCDLPEKTLEKEQGWRAFCIEGVLDFSLIGILSKISGCLAENGIGLFAVSTFNTDYILVKEENFERALSLLAREGFEVIR